ncbi:hypothetical protein [Burkholderia cepacia]|uniref:hypothetical protein n=1 Tax=Burkholderia cepacia TaxID=292 RepID=UPI001CF339BD|nr:hypothetical protein [Burkholderia cepacia]MCA8353048.1 hypothetical protein [Burkholderia cepacia]
MNAFEAGQEFVHLERENLVAHGLRAKLVELDSPVRWIVDGRSVDERVLRLLKQPDRLSDMGTTRVPRRSTRSCFSPSDYDFHPDLLHGERTCAHSKGDAGVNVGQHHGCTA